MTSSPIKTAPRRSRALKASLLAGTVATLAVLTAMPAQAETAMERRVRVLEQELNAIKSGQKPTEREAALEKRVVELENELKN
ncbi:MAG: hypothetical protein ACM3N5_07265, partial [Candidatus Eiseniibacteriota bacterium]